MKKTNKFLISLSAFAIFILPAISLAYTIGDPLVQPCTSVSGAGGTYCGWSDLLNLINNTIQFILYGLAMPIAAIMFAYAGFLLVTAGGEAAHARTKAKSIFTNALIGLVIAVAAFLIIRTLLSILGYNGTWIGF